MVTFDDVRRLGLRLPEVTESTWYGTPGLKVRNKGFCRLWGEREHRRDQVHDTEVLVVFCELEMKPVLLENHPDVLFTVPHYDGYGAVLVRLADDSSGSPTPTSTTSPIGSRTATGGSRRPRSSARSTTADRRWLTAGR